MIKIISNCIFRKSWLWVGLFSLLAQSVQSQGNIPSIDNRGASTSSSRDTTFSGTQQEDSNTIDTFGVYYVSQAYPAFTKPYQDTALTRYSHQYDPTRLSTVDFAHLGHLGSAMYPLLYTPEQHRGFHIGLDAFNPYLKNGNDLPFYIVKKAFSELGFVLGSEQADESVYAKFGKNFAKGISLSLDYNRISQLGRLSQYNRQNTRNTNLVTGLRFHRPNTPYDGFFTFSANTIEQEDNGGVYIEPKAEDIGNGATFSLSSGAIMLSDAQTRHQYRTWGYTQYYQLRKIKRDSSRSTTNKRIYKIAHDFRYSRDKYKFSSTQTASDTFFRQWFSGFDIDERGYRSYVTDYSISNQFRIITHSAQKKGYRPSIFTGDYLSLGIIHQRHNLQMEPSDTLINNLFLTGEWILPIKDRFRLEAMAHLGLWDNVGDYKLSGHLKINLRKAGLLSAGVNSQLTAPSWLQSQFYITQKIVWKNDFKKSLTNSLQGSYELPKYNFKAKAVYRLLHNHIYYDTLGFPQQVEAPISILSLVLTKDFKLGKFHLNNTLVWQSSSSDLLPVPQWFGKHSLFFGSKFRKMLFQLGVDVRYLDKYKAYYYNPLTGNFQLQNRQTLDFYPNLDAWFSFKITSFRFFVKYENMTRLLGRDSFFYTTAFYPFPNEGMRLGIRWKMVN